MGCCAEWIGCESGNLTERKRDVSGGVARLNWEVGGPAWLGMKQHGGRTQACIIGGDQIEREKQGPQEGESCRFPGLSLRDIAASLTGA